MLCWSRYYNVNEFAFVTFAYQHGLLPQPAYLKALNGEHDGSFSTTLVDPSAPLDADGLFAIISTLEFCRGLHTVRLVSLHRAGSSLLKKDTLISVVGVVRGSAYIKCLDLSDNMLTDEIAAHALSKLLPQNNSLTSLSLRYNLLGHASGKAIFNGLTSNKTLTALDLSGNPSLKWQGQAFEFARIVKENPSISSFGASMAEPVCGYHPPAHSLSLAFALALALAFAFALALSL